MIGLRIGQRFGPRIGVGMGGAGGASDFLVMLGLAQSNGVGFTDWGATGTVIQDKGAADLGYGYGTPFPAVTMNESYANSAGNPIVWIETGTVPLQPYKPAGQSNMGIELSLGRYLVRYGIYANPYIAKCAVAASSLPLNWLQSSGFPAIGEKLYDHWLLKCRAAMSAAGRPIDAFVSQIGETDSATPARVLSCVADHTAFWTSTRADLGLPDAVVFVVMLNANHAGGDPAGYRTQQLAYAATDPTRIIAVEPGTDLPVPADPHYVMSGYQCIGERVAVAIRRKFKPALTADLSTGPVPWLQQAAPGETAVASPITARPHSGPEDRAGDIQLLVCVAYAVTVTITLPVAAGFAAVGAQFESNNAGAQHRTLAVFSRVVDQPTLDANGGIVPPPSVDFGAATLNVARIFTIRGSSGIDTSSTGVNNGNTTALTIAGGTTTANNCLMFIIALTAGTTNALSTVANAGLTSITTQWDSKYNPFSGNVQMCIVTATKAVAGAYGSTAVTFVSTGVNAGMVIALKP